MKEKIDCKNLYVGCRVSVYDHLIEPWVQYETFGKEFHSILIDPKRRLVLLEEIDGKKVYKVIFEDREINPVEYESSYYSKSSSMGSTYCAYINGLYNSGIPGLNRKLEDEYKEKSNGIGYLVPFDEFIEKSLNIKVEKVTLLQAKTLLKFANLIQSKPFVLSEDKNIAKQQIDTKVYKKRNSK